MGLEVFQFHQNRCPRTYFSIIHVLEWRRTDFTVRELLPGKMFLNSRSYTASSLDVQQNTRLFFTLNIIISWNPANWLRLLITDSTLISLLLLLNPSIIRKIYINVSMFHFTIGKSSRDFTVYNLKKTKISPHEELLEILQLLHYEIFYLTVVTSYSSSISFFQSRLK